MKHWLFAVLVLAVIGATTARQLLHTSASASTTASSTSAQSTATSAMNSLVADMNQAIAATSSISASATVIDSDTGKEYDAGNSTTLYQGASTAKMLAVVDYLHQVELGKATLTQTLDGMTAQQAIKQMIEISDNDAWTAMNSYLGDGQQAYARSIGMSNYTAGDYNTMTTADEAKLLAQLASGQLLTSAHRALLYGYMANTDSTNLIQAALPADATVYHKYGEIFGNLHDAAIVQYQGHTFVLVIFTNNPAGTTDAYDTQVALIHTITEAAYKDVTAPNAPSQE